MSAIVEFVHHGATFITPGIVERMLRNLPMWKVEFTQIQAPTFPHLVDQLEFLANVVEDVADGVYKDLPYVALAETVFALLYAHRKIDIIPDNIPNVGHTDDSSIVRAVLTQYEKHFAKYAATNNLNWTRITSKP